MLTLLIKFIIGIAIGVTGLYIYNSYKEYKLKQSILKDMENTKEKKYPRK